MPESGVQLSVACDEVTLVVYKPVGIGHVEHEITETEVADEVAEQPKLFVTLTEYDPEEDTVIVCAVCPPGVHKYDWPLLAVN